MEDLSLGTVLTYIKYCLLAILLTNNLIAKYISMRPVHTCVLLRPLYVHILDDTKNFQFKKGNRDQKG